MSFMEEWNLRYSIFFMLLVMLQDKQWAENCDHVSVSVNRSHLLLVFMQYLRRKVFFWSSHLVKIFREVFRRFWDCHLTIWGHAGLFCQRSGQLFKWITSCQIYQKWIWNEYLYHICHPKDVLNTFITPVTLACSERSHWIIVYFKHFHTFF